MRGARLETLAAITHFARTVPADGVQQVHRFLVRTVPDDVLGHVGHHLRSCWYVHYAGATRRLLAVARPALKTRRKAAGREGGGGSMLAGPSRRGLEPKAVDRSR